MSISPLGPIPLAFAPRVHLNSLLSVLVVFLLFSLPCITCPSSSPLLQLTGTQTQGLLHTSHHIAIGFTPTCPTTTPFTSPTHIQSTLLVWGPWCSNLQRGRVFYHLLLCCMMFCMYLHLLAIYCLFSTSLKRRATMLSCKHPLCHFTTRDSCALKPGSMTAM